MNVMHETELRPLLDKTENEVMSYVQELIGSNNATNWQKVSELSFLFRRSEKKSVAVKIAKMMYEKSPTLDKLNQYFVAVVDHANIGEVKELDQMVQTYLTENHLGYQKHLFATWLKAANLILDDTMFYRIYDMIPSEEKTENTYIVSQYYVFLNRHSQYAEVREHYQTLLPNIQNSTYVKRYYLNASRHMGFEIPGVSRPNKIDGSSEQPEEQILPNSGEKKVFIVYGNNPASLDLLKALLQASNIPCEILNESKELGNTVIDNFEKMAEQSSLALVLCTPEIEGKDGKWYPKQNVIFELGYFRAKIGANRTCILRQTDGKNLEMPSDLGGVMFINADNPASLVKDLSRALKTAGFNPTF